MCAAQSLSRNALSKLVAHPENLARSASLALYPSFFFSWNVTRASCLWWRDQWMESRIRKCSFEQTLMWRFVTTESDFVDSRLAPDEPPPRMSPDCMPSSTLTRFRNVAFAPTVQQGINQGISYLHREWKGTHVCIVLYSDARSHLKG